jgi:cytochrome c oxidase assembly protein subunit 15
VNFDARYLAMLHGITGPIVFALTMIQVAAINSDLRAAYTQPNSLPLSNPSVFPLAALTTLLAYGQLVLGAQLRHAEWLSPHQFRAIGIFHMIGASVISLAILLLWFFARRTTPETRRGSRWLLALVIVQLFFGLGTWLVNFGWPGSSENVPAWVWKFVPEQPTARSMQQTLTTTTHVALGSLILGISAALTFVAWGQRRAIFAPSSAEPRPAATRESKLLRTRSAAGGLA